MLDNHLFMLRGPFPYVLRSRSVAQSFAMQCFTRTPTAYAVRRRLKRFKPHRGASRLQGRRGGFFFCVIFFYKRLLILLY